TEEGDGVDPLALPRDRGGLEPPFERPEPAIGAPPFGAEPRRALQRRPVAELYEGRVGEKEIEELADGIARSLAEVLPLAEGGDHELPDLAVHALLHLAVQGLLGGKVVVEARAPHPLH